MGKEMPKVSLHGWKQPSFTPKPKNNGKILCI